MIYIISGAVDEGKTRMMAAIYTKLKKGDGFISKKIYEGPNPGVFSGYEIIRLATGQGKPLAYKTGHIPPRWDEIYACGPYRFSKAGLEFARGIIENIIDRDIAPVFIDEIGPLELTGKGFAPLLKRALKTGKDIYITVRNFCVADVIEKFALRDYEIIEVNKKNEHSN
jgi:nucleoside-triphosphatase THEP1